MKPVDNYLECLYEGEKWDKVKAFAKKHKGKIIAGAGAALAAGALARGKHLYDKSPAGQAKQAAEFEAARKKKAEDDKKVARFKEEDRKSKKFRDNVKNNVGGAASVANAALTPYKWAVKKGLDAVGVGIKSGSKYVGNKVAKTVVDAKDRHRLRDQLK